MSIMRVLKLSYMAHGWALAVIEKPLVNEYVQAWRYGPVIPSIYYSYRPQGVYNLKPVDLVQEVDLDDETVELLPAVYDIYKHLSDNALSALTHLPGGPWHSTYKPNKLNIIIPNDLIAAHFKDKLERSEHENTEH